MIFTKDDISNLIRDADLERLRPEIERATKPSIQLHFNKFDEANIPIGATKFGGVPDLPNGFEWPMCADAQIKMHPDYWNVLDHGAAPLWFIMQLSLSEVAPFDLESVFPSSGILYFFSAVHRASAMGIFPDAWRVVYFNGDLSELCRTDVPPASSLLREALAEETLLPSSYVLESCLVEFNLSFNVPSELDVVMTAQELKSYNSFFAEVFSFSRVDRHQLLGYAKDLNGNFGSLEREAEETSPHAEALDDLLEKNHLLDAERRGALKKECRNRWRLLLQVGQQLDVGLELPGGGLAYFWISTNGLARHEFHHTCYMNKCT